MAARFFSMVYGGALSRSGTCRLIREIDVRILRSAYGEKKSGNYCTFEKSTGTFAKMIHTFFESTYTCRKRRALSAVLALIGLPWA